MRKQSTKNPSDSWIMGKVDLPDTFVFSPGNRPPSDLVMSRSQTGEVISRYCYSSWDFRHHESPPNGDLVFYFIGERIEGYEEDLKWLTFLAMNYPGSRKCRPKSSTVRAELHLLKSFIYFSKKRNISLHDFFSTPEYLTAFFYFSTKNMQRRMKSLLKFFNSISAEVSGFYFSLPNSIFGKKGSNDSDSDQTAPIPERIFLAAITKLNNITSEYLENEKNIHSLCKKLHESNFYGRCHITQKNAGICKKEYLPNFEEALYLHNLRELAQKHRIKNVANLCRYLSTVQFCCKTSIHIFTGMRDKEAARTRTNCLLKKTFNSIETLHLISVTTKMALRRDDNKVQQKGNLKEIQER